jgi:hypothetical protein
LGSLIALREELMEGDLRALYIVWLASQRLMGSADVDDKEDNDEEDNDEEDEISVPPRSTRVGDADVSTASARRIVAGAAGIAGRSGSP